MATPPNGSQRTWPCWFVVSSWSSRPSRSCFHFRPPTCTPFSFFICSSQVRGLEGGYPGGVAAYTKQAQKLLSESAAGANPFEGYTPEVLRHHAPKIPSSAQFCQLFAGPSFLYFLPSMLFPATNKRIPSRLSFPAGHRAHFKSPRPPFILAYHATLHPITALSTNGSRDGFALPPPLCCFCLSYPWSRLCSRRRILPCAGENLQLVESINRSRMV